MSKKTAKIDEFESQLFFGFLADPSFQSKIDPKLKALFVKEDGSYLQEFFFDDNQSFLGKMLGNNCSLRDIEQISLNILSLLLKLVPTYPYDTSQFIIIAKKV